MADLSQQLSFDSANDDEFDVTLDAPEAAPVPAGKGVAAAQRAPAGRKPRYFVLKSLTPFNIEQSLEKGIWATQVRGRWHLLPCLLAV